MKTELNTTSKHDHICAAGGYGLFLAVAIVVLVSFAIGYGAGTLGEKRKNKNTVVLHFKRSGSAWKIEKIDNNLSVKVNINLQ